MNNLPLFPKAIRLMLYAIVGIGGLASVPAIVSHVRSTAGSLAADGASTGDFGDSSKPAHKKSAGTISILPVGPAAEAQRKAELAAARARLQASVK